MPPDMDDPLVQAKVAAGRACVRLLEAAEVLLADGSTGYERVIYLEACDLARRRLRGIVRGQEPMITVLILEASQGPNRAANLPKS
jgi:hypothetical protein